MNRFPRRCGDRPKGRGRPSADEYSSLSGCLHRRNLVTSAPHADDLDANRVAVRVELHEHAWRDLLRGIGTRPLRAEHDMEHVGLWIVTGPDHSFAPLSQCAVTTNISLASARWTTRSTRFPNSGMTLYERLMAGSVASCVTRSGEVRAASM